MKIHELKASLLRFWYFKIRNRKCKVLKQGGFTAEFYSRDLRIKTDSGNFSMMVRATEHPFGYLAASVGKGIDENVHGFEVLVYSIVMNITKDQKLFSDVRRALNSYYQRVAHDKKINELLTEEQNLAIVKSEQEYAEMSRPERRRARRAMEKAFKDGKTGDSK